MIERLHHGVHAADHVRLHASERRKAQGGQLRLKLADVVTAKREVVDQVRSARAVLGVEGVDRAGGLELQHLRAEKLELVN